MNPAASASLGTPQVAVSDPIRVMVVDDAVVVRSLLSRWIAETPDLKLVAAVRNGREAVEQLDQARPDVVVLDIEMPELDGIGVVRMLKKDEMPLIAFVTAYDEYAVRAFEVNAVDYLLKPVEKRRLREPREEPAA